MHSFTLTLPTCRRRGDSSEATRRTTIYCFFQSFSLFLYDVTRHQPRYMVMDACHLGFKSDTFAGVVDKGTLDATISGGGDTARRICQEAMRVLKPGGTFLVVSNAPAGILLDALLDMCGPEAMCDAPLPVPVGRSTEVVYAYTIIKEDGNWSVGDAVAAALAFEEDGDDERGWPAIPPLPPPAQLPGWLMPSNSSPSSVECCLRRRGSSEEECLLEPGGDGAFEVVGDDESSVLADDGNGARALSELIESFERENSGGAGGGGNGGEALLSGYSSGKDDADGAIDGGSDSSSSSPRAIDITKHVFAHPEERVKRNGESFQAELAALLQESNLDSEKRERGDWPDDDDGAYRNLEEQQVGSSEAAAAEAARLRAFEDTLDALERYYEVERSPRSANGAAHHRTLAKGSVATSPAVSKMGPGGGSLIESLPWGVNITQYEEDPTFVTVEVDVGAELKTSLLSVEFAPTRLKVSRGLPGDRRTVLDSELTGRIIVADSTWSIEDKTVLCLR